MGLLTTQQRVFIVTNYTLTQSVTEKTFICEIVLLASIVNTFLGTPYFLGTVEIDFTTVKPY